MESLVTQVASVGGIATVAFKEPVSPHVLEAGIRAPISKETVSAGVNLLISAGGKVRHELWTIGAVSAELPPEAIRVLWDHPSVDYIEPRTIGELAAVPPGARRVAASLRELAAAGAQGGQITPWGISLTKFLEAWQYGTGSGAKVLVIDTGHELGHSDLPLVDTTRCGGPSGGCDDASPPSHGTHVSGIALARNNSIGVIGGAWGVNDGGVHMWGACAQDGGCFSDQVIAGVNKGVEWNVDVINMSLRLNNSLDLQNAVQAAYSANLILVAAAGNDGGREVVYPAGYSNAVIGVSGVTPDGSFASTSPCGNSSNYGPHVELSAPFWARSTVPPSAYGDDCGTSMATPHVTAAAALMRGVSQGF